MHAIKIDPVAKTITEIELAQNPNETLQELYNLIGCDLKEGQAQRNQRRLYLPRLGNGDCRNGNRPRRQKHTGGCPPEGHRQKKYC